MAKNNFTFIDLFSGAGGLSEGFIREGFSPIAHVDMDNNACKTLTTRLAYHYLNATNNLNTYRKYLVGEIDRNSLYSNLPKMLFDSVINLEIKKSNIQEIFTQIDQLLSLNNYNKINVIIGGPPCQAYSNVGRSKMGTEIKNDKRNFLYKQYGKFLVKYQPDMFIFENVPGLYTAGDGIYYNDLRRYFKNIGYNLEDKILNSSDYGALQNRNRVILIGWKLEHNFSYPNLPKNPSKETIYNLFADLPKIKPGDSLNCYKMRMKRSGVIKKLRIQSKFDLLLQHIARPHNDKDLEIYKIAINMWNNNNRLKYSDLPQHLKSHKNEASFKDRFKVVNGEGLSHTVVAHISKDGHYYIHPDINQLRSISVREAARIQTFPDDFYFESSRTAAFKQIGNAVPPLLAEQIAREIKRKLS